MSGARTAKRNMKSVSCEQNKTRHTHAQPVVNLLCPVLPVRPVPYAVTLVASSAMTDLILNYTKIINERKRMNKNKLNWDKITFATACRENTGVAMCDSGGDHGRNWQQPPIPEDAPEIRDWHEGCPATIETATFLKNQMEILRDLQKEWQEFNESLNENPENDVSWFESAEKFMEDDYPEYQKMVKGNVYNEENDLSSVYTFTVYKQKCVNDDWIYFDSTDIVVMHMHTGADVRGGYGRPVFCRSKGDYSVPLDLRAEYCAIDGDNIDNGDDIDDKWSCRYSNSPYSMLEKDVAEWHEDTRTQDSVEVTLNSGLRVRVTAYAPHD
jgi:hypothetical protein